LAISRRVNNNLRVRRAEWFVQRDAVQSAHQRPHQLRNQDTVAGMAPIPRRQELDVGTKDWTD
jgi:hypothetical protein